MRRPISAFLALTLLFLGGLFLGGLALPQQSLAQQVPVLPQSVRPPDNATISDNPTPPINLAPAGSRADLWRQIREGSGGGVEPPTLSGSTLIQSQGEDWRLLRDGAYRHNAELVLLGMIVLLALFFTLRGRIRIRSGKSGVEIRRFNGLERFAHWLTAICFIVLALTGLNLMLGRGLLLPYVDKALFAQLSMWGKVAHNSLGFGFMVGIALMLVLWVWNNIPHPRDLIWLLKGGGILGGAHVPSTKFNAGQKLIFWIVILGGASLSLSGWALLKPPYELHLFAASFAALNDWFGFSLPVELDALQELQLNQLWHGAVGVVMTAVILAHIYIGSVGMQGAFAAMGRGRVDLNWAREHHDLWVKKLEQRGEVPRAPAE